MDIEPGDIEPGAFAEVSETVRHERFVIGDLAKFLARVAKKAEG